jgi:hypothetical protein
MNRLSRPLYPIGLCAAKDNPILRTHLRKNVSEVIQLTVVQIVQQLQVDPKQRTNGGAASWQSS